MQRLLMLSVSAVVAIYSANAIADSSHLKGTYGFTGSSACLSATGGFNASLQALGTATSSSESAEGIRIFNGDGTGSFTISGISLTAPPTVGFFPAASSTEASASSTDTVTDDTFITKTVPGTDKGTFLTGPRKGQTFTLEGAPELTGLISADRRTLITSTLTPGVETFTISDGTVIHRICHRSRVYIKLDNDGAN